MSSERRIASGVFVLLLLGAAIFAGTRKTGEQNTRDSAEAARSANGTSAPADRSGSRPIDPKLSPFAGNWKVSSGSGSVKCAGQPDRQINPAGNQIAIVPNADGTLEVTMGKCTTRYSVAGQTATALPGQICETETREMRTRAETLSSTLSVQGSTATATSRAKTAMHMKNGAQVDCTLSGQSHLSRVL